MLVLALFLPMVITIPYFLTQHLAYQVLSISIPEPESLKILLRGMVGIIMIVYKNLYFWS